MKKTSDKYKIIIELGCFFSKLRSHFHKLSINKKT